MDEISKAIEQCINTAIDNFDDSYELGSPFEETLSFGELVDRLAIVNFKLYTLKNETIRRNNDKFRAWSSVEDVNLCRERSRLKNCLNEKLIAEIARSLSNSGTVITETKLYE